MPATSRAAAADATSTSLPLLRRRLLAWYDASARDLPWRGGGCTAYRVLVSEFMLQQTQVATVIPYFDRFIRALPDVHALAAADEQRVLRLWQGLGYYSRARNLHRAAKAIVERHGGEVPRRVEDLMALPGIGRYTAGAVASIAFEDCVPVLDGNVARVLCRLEAIRSDPKSSAVRQKLWKWASQLLPARRCGDFNSALMELGAMICKPRRPACAACPLQRHCRAQARGLQEQIPRSAPRKALSLVLRDVLVIQSARGEYLVEQRPPAGRWARMWQFITRPRDAAPPVRTTPPVLLATLRHALTHRRYELRVFTCSSRSSASRGARWASASTLDELPMPLPHVRIRKMLEAKSLRRLDAGPRERNLA